MHIFYQIFDIWIKLLSFILFAGISSVSEKYVIVLNLAFLDIKGFEKHRNIL